MMWRAVESSAIYLNDDIRKIRLAYTPARNFRPNPKQRWKECSDEVSVHFQFVLSAMYVRKYFNREAKNNVTELVMEIRQQFYDSLDKVEWLDEKARQSALEKAASLIFHIAYDDELLDDNKLEELYENLEFSGETYLENILDLIVFNTQRHLSMLRKPRKMSLWTVTGPRSFLSSYSQTEHSVQLPAGNLQDVYFSTERPKYMNYGAIGLVIGHELTHSFDYSGRKSDMADKRWQTTTETNFPQLVDCIIHYYTNYTDEKAGLKLNGSRTRHENIADNGGIKLAYLAYDNWVKINGPEQKLPGLSYSPKQMFWISYANTRCVKRSSDLLKRRIKNSKYSPNKFRVLGPLSNMPEFSTDFNCPVGSNMNPEKKCSVW